MGIHTQDRHTDTMADCLLGLVGDGFALVASDTKAGRGPVIMNTEVQKTFKLNDHNVMLTGGELGDITNFSEFIQRNVQLYEKRFGVALSPTATANMTRSQLAGSLRTRNHFYVNTLLAGYDTHEKEGSLYFCDYFGSMAKAPYACHGHAAYFCLSIFDVHYKEKMSLKEATMLMKKCFDELKVRYALNVPKFQVSVIDADGVRSLNIDESDQEMA